MPNETKKPMREDQQSQNQKQRQDQDPSRRDNSSRDDKNAERQW